MKTTTENPPDFTDFISLRQARLTELKKSLAKLDAIQHRLDKDLKPTKQQLTYLHSLSA